MGLGHNGGNVSSIPISTISVNVKRCPRPYPLLLLWQTVPTIGLWQPLIDFSYCPLKKFCFLFQKALSSKIEASNWDVLFEDSVKIKHLSPFITVCFSPVAEIYALCYSLKIEDFTGVKLMWKICWHHVYDKLICKIWRNHNLVN